MDEGAYDFEDDTCGRHGHRRQWCRKDNLRRQAGRTAPQSEVKKLCWLPQIRSVPSGRAVERVGEPCTKQNMIGGQEGSDPAAVVYDAVAAAKARHADVLLIDTAGRLHNKKNLMEELRKMNKIIDREFPDAYRETLVVLDATTGQNALAQAKEFNEVADITGVILTKMDGTAKGGIAVAIQAELGIPVKYIGVGETIDDLQKFNSDTFVNALFNVKGEHEVC